MIGSTAIFKVGSAGFEVADPQAVVRIVIKKRMDNIFPMRMFLPFTIGLFHGLYNERQGKTGYISLLPDYTTPRINHKSQNRSPLQGGHHDTSNAPATLAASS